MKATPLSILLTKKVNTNLPARDPEASDEGSRVE